MCKGAAQALLLSAEPRAAQPPGPYEEAGVASCGAIRKPLSRNWRLHEKLVHVLGCPCSFVSEEQMVAL